MQRFFLGFRALVRVWRDRRFAQRVEELIGGGRAPAPPPSGPPRVSRSEALTLLAVLQREGRLVDFVQEPIDGYSDAQVGAAVRDVHKGCRAALDRLLGLQPLLTEAEGTAVTVPAGADPARYNLTGNVTGTPPFRGTLRHHGWRAGHCSLPEWQGQEESVWVVAPAEVELV